MKTLLIFALSFTFTFSLAQSKTDAILGVWLTQIQDAKVEVYKKNNKYYGRVIWIADPEDKYGNPVKDVENPNEQLRNRPILRIDILTGFSYDDGEWINGKIYDPKNGASYECKLWLENGKLKVRGYVGWFFDTKTWTKVE